MEKSYPFFSFQKTWPRTSNITNKIITTIITNGFLLQWRHLAEVMIIQIDICQAQQTWQLLNQLSSNSNCKSKLVTGKGVSDLKACLDYTYSLRNNYFGS